MRHEERDFSAHLAQTEMKAPVGIGERAEFRTYHLEVCTLQCHSIGIAHYARERMVRLGLR